MRERKIHKAHIFSNGLCQQYDMDYKEKISPVDKMTTICSLIATTYVH